MPTDKPSLPSDGKPNLTSDGKKARKRMVVEEVGTSEDVAAETLVSKPADPVEIKSDPPSTETTTDPPAVESKVEEEESQVMPEDNLEPVSVPETATSTAEPVVETVEALPLTEPKVVTVAPEIFQEQPSQLVPILKNSDSTNPFIVIIPGIFLLGALLGGIYFYQKSIGPASPVVSTPSPQPLVTLEPVVTNPPSGTPSATLDLTKYPINVLNGSGIVGEAARVKTTLTAAGFKVSAVGNASSSDFTKTVVKAKADVSADFLKKLSDTLSKTYTLDTSQTLATSATDGVQVIIGSTKAK